MSSITAKPTAASRPRFFKWKTLTLGAGERRALEKRHPIKRITTRVYYPGAHRVEIQVNGAIQGGADFDLET